MILHCPGKTSVQSSLGPKLALSSDSSPRPLGRDGIVVGWTTMDTSARAPLAKGLLSYSGTQRSSHSPISITGVKQPKTNNGKDTHQGQDEQATRRGNKLGCSFLHVAHHRMVSTANRKLPSLSTPHVKRTKPMNHELPSSTD